VGWSGVESLQLEGLDGLSDSFLLLAAATCPRLSTLAVEYCSLSLHFPPLSTHAQSALTPALPAFSSQGDLRGGAHSPRAVVPLPAAHVLLWLPRQPPLTSFPPTVLSHAQSSLPHREISEAGLIPLVQSCHSLQHMCFSGFRASHLSDLLLHTIASHCSLLSTLSLRACNGVTTQGVVCVLQGCGQITRCQLVRCQEVDEEWVVRAAREVGEVRARGAGGSGGAGGAGGAGGSRRGAGEMPVIEIS
ncbi:unnamed protein product, partial [Closterium sp. NIES-53]